MNPNDFATLNLTDCTFEYFHKDYKALIHVENNNIVIQNLTAALYPDHSPNVMVLGDDRGVNIYITNSIF